MWRSGRGGAGWRGEGEPVRFAMHLYSGAIRACVVRTHTSCRQLQGHASRLRARARRVAGRERRRDSTADPTFERTRDLRGPVAVLV